MFQNSTLTRPRCARCARPLSIAAHVAAFAVPAGVPPVLVCSQCHGVTLTSADAATALRAKVLRGRHSLALQRAEQMFERGAA